MKGLEQPAEEDVETGRIASLWERYSFPGTPPPLDSVEGQRLFDTCRSYLDYALANKSPSFPQYDSENIYSSMKVDNWGDRRRRELHNNIALAVAGKERSLMEGWEAGEIANFASELVLGEDLESARQHRKDFQE